MSGNSWGAKHKGLLAVVGAAAATALTAGAASPALAATLGGTAAAEGAGAAGLGAAGASGLGTAALFGPTAGGSALAAESAAIPSITSAGAAGSGLGGGTSSLFGGQGLLAGSSPQMFTAGLGAGPGGASLPTFGDKVASGLSNVLPGGNDTLSSLRSGMSKLSKAQQAYKTGSGLLGGGQPAQGGGGVSPSQAFGQRATPTNLTQYLNQPGPGNFTQYASQNNSMLPPQLAMLPPNDPRVLAYLQQMQGGMYG